MALPCPTCLPLDCDLLEDTNLYSIEQALFPFVISCPSGFDCSNPTQFSMVCCGQVLSAQFPPNATVDDKQAIIQSIVNQCGVRLAFCGELPNTPDTPIILLYNRTQQCTVFCPDGSPFVFVVAAGTFAGTDQATVDKQAADFACVQAGLRKVCLGPIPSCLCGGSLYSSTIPHSGGIGPFVWNVFSGALPDGLALDQTGTISGTPTTAGIFTFTIQVTEPDGSYMRKVYTMTVIVIESSLPDYTVGVPYSHQLAVTGGSGNYAVKLDSGVFPDGLVLDATGLIHGTPTGATAGTMPLVFDVIDLNCVAIDRSFFVPRVSITGHSTTTIATLYGYNEYPGHASTPPKKYHTLTWTGKAVQTGHWSSTSETFEWYFANNVPTTDSACIRAKYEFSGQGNFDSKGNLISTYNKNYFAACKKFEPLFDSNIIELLNSFPICKGYCWPYDPASCVSCPTDVDSLPLVGNFQSNSPLDICRDFLNGGFGAITTATTLVQNLDTGGLFLLKNGGPGGVNNFPQSTWNGISGPWVEMGAVINIAATLTNEYTDAEALANALIINSNGTTAETFARTTGFVSRWTTVAFDLSFSNLLTGQSYLATVDLLDSNGTKVIRQYGFTATDVTHVIHDTVPVPAQGHTITARKPTVVYAP